MQPGNLILKIKNNLFCKALQKDNHSNDILMTEILNLFKTGKKKISDISRIFVNLGPGSFSGIRGSIATCKGISLASKIEILGYNSFQLLNSSCDEDTRPSGFLVKINNNYFLKYYNEVNKFDAVEIVSKDKIINILKRQVVVSSHNYTNSLDLQILNSKNFKLIKVNYQKLESLYNNNLLQKKFIQPLYV